MPKGKETRMSMCKNPECGAILREHFWGEGYCCKRCMEKGEDYSAELHERQPHPDDVGQLRRELARCADLADALAEAAAIDPRLPRIIHYRRKGKTYRQIGKLAKCDAATAMRLLRNVPDALRNRCGLAG